MFSYLVVVVATMNFANPAAADCEKSIYCEDRGSSTGPSINICQNLSQSEQDWLGMKITDFQPWSLNPLFFVTI